NFLPPISTKQGLSGEPIRSTPPRASCRSSAISNSRYLKLVEPRLATRIFMVVLWGTASVPFRCDGIDELLADPGTPPRAFPTALANQRTPRSTLRPAAESRGCQRARRLAAPPERRLRQPRERCRRRLAR